MRECECAWKAVLSALESGTRLAGSRYGEAQIGMDYVRFGHGKRPSAHLSRPDEFLAPDVRLGCCLSREPVVVESWFASRPPQRSRRWRELANPLDGPHAAMLVRARRCPLNA
jgi:hypothetical protein